MHIFSQASWDSVSTCWRGRGERGITLCFDRHCDHLILVRILVRILCLLNGIVFLCASNFVILVFTTTTFSFFCRTFSISNLFYVAFMLPLRTNAWLLIKLLHFCSAYTYIQITSPVESIIKVSMLPKRGMYL